MAGRARDRSAKPAGYGAHRGSLFTGHQAGRFRQRRDQVGATEAPLLPQSAVQSDQRGSYVYVVTPQNEVARRDVEVGSVTNGGVIIKNGLSGQERIVLSAGAFLNPGQKVIPARAPAR
jgi:multidrug efflux pump subunit AcrA (membrane-fusion protein)